jgi:hypothetical protein
MFTFLFGAGLFIAGFVVGILVTRKNKKGVEAAIAEIKRKNPGMVTALDDLSRKIGTKR